MVVGVIVVFIAPNVLGLAFVQDEARRSRDRG